MKEDVKKLKEEVKKLTETVEELKKRLGDAVQLQDDFGGKQIIRRPVQFMAEVTDKNGTNQFN